MKRVVVEQATLAELDLAVPLYDAYRQFQGVASDPKAARRFLAQRLRLGESVVLLARTAGGGAVGFAQLFHIYSSISLASVYILNDLYVDASARRAGIAALLLDEAERFARRTGAVRLSLNTAVDNLPAQKLYEARGWSRTDRHYIAYHRNLEP
ncbi:MAG: GNAT family N-acetyltransferase [Pseudomonadota bacterium]